MVPLLLGGLALLLLLGGLKAFAGASPATVRSFLAWFAALAGLSLTVLLVLTGKGPIAFFALSLALPLLRDWWQGRRGGAAGPSSSRVSPPPGPMSEQEAWEVLGLRPGATEEEIRAAHRRLMRAAHPDSGGSDWVAARVNQARDILLGKMSRGRR